MSREEVSYLGSARREEIRRQQDEHERLRANPLLYLVSPQVKVGSNRNKFVKDISHRYGKTEATVADIMSYLKKIQYLLNSENANTETYHHLIS